MVSVIRGSMSHTCAQCAAWKAQVEQTDELIDKLKGELAGLDEESLKFFYMEEFQVAIKSYEDRMAVYSTQGRGGLRGSQAGQTS